jgi:hypothetical protein
LRLRGLLHLLQMLILQRLLRLSDPLVPSGQLNQLHLLQMLILQRLLRLSDPLVPSGQLHRRQLQFLLLPSLR